MSYSPVPVDELEFFAEFVLRDGPVPLEEIEETLKHSDASAVFVREHDSGGADVIQVFYSNQGVRFTYHSSMVPRWTVTKFGCGWPADDYWIDGRTRVI
jgi:hypothetical protein